MSQRRDEEDEHELVEMLERLLARILNAMRHHRQQPEVASATLVAIRAQGATRMNVKSAGEKVVWSITEYDSEGTEIPQDTGTATWASTDDSVLVVTPSDDGYSAEGTLTDGALPGATAGVTCSLDVGRTKDDGSGNQVPDTIEMADSILVVSGDVATATLSGSVQPTA